MGVMAQQHRLAVGGRSRRRTRCDRRLRGAALQQAHGQGQLVGDDTHRVLVVIAEVLVLLTLQQQHAQHLALQPQRHGHLAARLGQTRHRNLLGAAIQTLILGALADGAGIGLPQGQVPHPQRNAFARRNAGHALAYSHLRAQTRVGVAMAGHGIQALTALVQQQQHGMLDQEFLLQAGHDLVQQLAHLATGSQAIAQAAGGGGQIAARLGGGQLAPPAQALHVQHAVHIRASQVVDLVHAGMRGDAGELGLHSLEQRAFALGAQVLKLQAHAGGGVGVVDGDGGAPCGQDVLAAAVEELERQSHMLLVHILGLRQVAQMRHTLGRGAAQHGRDHALEHAADLPQAHLAVAGATTVCGRAHANSSIGAPAPGPGVWFQAPVGKKLMPCRSSP